MSFKNVLCVLGCGLWLPGTFSTANVYILSISYIYEERSGVKYCDFLESLLRLTLQYVVSTGRKICIALAD